MTVFGYTRVSTTEQAADDRSSLDTQRRKIAAAAELSGLTVDQFIEEPGVSGGKPLAERPEGGPLLARLVKGDVLVVAKLDRAFRNAADALATAEQLKARKVDLIVADMGSEPVTQNGVSRMFFGMLALVAEFERERIKERSAEGRIAKRRDGGHIGGSAPFGFRKIGTGRAARLEPDPAQQAALADMRQLAAEGKASRAIAAAIQERHGLAVSHVTVRAALAREASPPQTTKPSSQSSRNAAILAELDARNAPDIEYRAAFSTGTKIALKKGETWRGRLEAWVQASPEAARGGSRRLA